MLLIGLLSSLLASAPALAESKSGSLSAGAIRATSCPTSGCEWRQLPFYAHGTIPLPTWDRCVIWELRARLNYKVDPQIYAGPVWHVYDGISFTNTRMAFRVRRYCEASGTNPTRLLGGLHARPAIHMTDTGAGSCALNPSVGFSFPWAVGVSVSPSCDRAKVARREDSVVWSRTSDRYSMTEAEPTRTQLRYASFETNVLRDWYSDAYHNVVCFRVNLSGSAEHPRLARAASFAKSNVRCVNLNDGLRP